MLTEDNMKRIVGSEPNVKKVNPSCLFVRAIPSTLGRNTFRGPWFNGLDGALLKNFRITEIVKAQFRFEALNLDNHPNFDYIPMDLNSGAFGKAQGLVGQAPARRLQLGLRILF